MYALLMQDGTEAALNQLGVWDPQAMENSCTLMMHGWLSAREEKEIEQSRIENRNEKIEQLKKRQIS